MQYRIWVQCSKRTSRTIPTKDYHNHNIINNKTPDKLAMLPASKNCLKTVFDEENDCFIILTQKSCLAALSGELLQFCAFTNLENPHFLKVLNHVTLFAESASLWPKLIA